MTVSVAEHCRRIKAHIAKGDRAIEKADEHYKAAGLHLKALKNEHGGSWDDWTKLLKTKVGISTGRASELMQIADGRKTVGELREADAAKHRRIRDQRSSGRPEENGTNVIPRPRVVFEAEERVIRAPATFSDAKPDGDGGPDDDDDKLVLDEEADPKELRLALLIRADQARQFAVYPDSAPVDDEVVNLVRAAASAWQSLAQKLVERVGSDTTLIEPDDCDGELLT